MSTILPAIVVFGSLNLDWSLRLAHLPTPGETVLAQALETTPGGKGGNQAIAAAKLAAAGQPVVMVGAVGEDAAGRQLIDALARAGVDPTAVAIAPTAPTGMAVVAVDAAGQNQIMVLPGANGSLTAADAQRLLPWLEPGAILLLQLEIPLDAVLAAAQLARAAGARVVLDPAPTTGALPPQLWSLVDWLTPNAKEAALLSGKPVGDRLSAERAARAFLARGARGVVITLGEAGALAAWRDQPGNQPRVLWQPAIAVATLDSVGAGDAFNGAFAVGLAEGRSLAACLRWAATAAALATTQAGSHAPDRPTLAARLAMITESVEL